MSVHQEESQELLEHRRWLKQQNADLQEHRKRHRVVPHDSDDVFVREDFAVGTDDGELAIMEETALYRSISLGDDLFGEHVTTEDVRHGSPESIGIFRSLESLSGGGDGEGADESADAAWLAAGKPPLLKRQRGFRQDSSWLAIEP
jgi:hypothetical protein